MVRLRKLLREIWEILREASGENDYARYYRHALARGEQPVTPQVFYRKKLQHKYSGISRCC
jgi:uncharacterized short protein YbdD (DUF466 family)